MYGKMYVKCNSFAFSLSFSTIFLIEKMEEKDGKNCATDNL